MAKTASNTAGRTRSGTTVATGDAVIGVVARLAAAHAAMPLTKIQRRAVPRSRTVARRDLYSSSSRGVIMRACTLWRGLWHKSWSRLGMGLSRTAGELDYSGNPLVFYELSATLTIRRSLTTCVGNPR